MAKSKRSKIKQANRAVARETLKRLEWERLEAVCLSLHKIAGFSQSFSATTDKKKRKIEHRGFEPITTYVPTPSRPKKFAVHQLVNGHYIQRDPHTLIREEEEERNQKFQQNNLFYEDTTKGTERVSSQGMMEVDYIRANNELRHKKSKTCHRRRQSWAIQKKRNTKHPHNKNIRRMAF
ncbi:hypothetical protein GpartN1_g6872.t1 [Galdieria partita]|uniref:Uncharacterized protein n=1 Tax=Galdieria partita TaxID=83374 RepID=A0A9C7Q2M5_9RHOD|nr:hypothetical protein GpartN1_g6872.t1 [Galdieria partita]